MKSRGSVKRRFRISKNGKAICSHSGRGHMKASKDGQTRRGKRKRMVIEGTWAVLMRRMMG